MGEFAGRLDFLDTEQVEEQAAGVSEKESGAPDVTVGKRSLAALGRLGIVLTVLALGAGGVWLTSQAGTPGASPTTTDIPALQVQPADVQPGSAAPADSTVDAGQDPAPQPQAQPQATQRPQPQAQNAQRSGNL